MSARIVGYDTLMKVELLEASDTHYTSSMKFDKCTGEVCVLIVLTGTGTGTITQQCSMNDVNWYDPVNASGSAVGTVCTAKAATTGTWISYSRVMSPYIRFKVVEAGGAATTTVTLTLIFQEER